MMTTSTNLVAVEIEDELEGEDTKEIPLIEIELAMGCYGAGPRGLVSSANGRSKVRAGTASGVIVGRASPGRTLPGW